jgi:hypothetical protein
MALNRFCDEDCGFLALKQLVSYVVSPQENPLEPDASLRAMYGLRVCRVRRDAEDALDTLHRELISRCLSFDFQLFQHDEKIASELSAEEIMDVSGPQRSTVSDLSPAGKDYFRRFIDELPNEKGVIIPLRPPVIAFHREEDLRSAERLELLAIETRETHSEAW